MLTSKQWKEIFSLLAIMPGADINDLVYLVKAYREVNNG